MDSWIIVKSESFESGKKQMATIIVILVFSASLISLVIENLILVVIIALLSLYFFYLLFACKVYLSDIKIVVEFPWRPFYRRFEFDVNNLSWIEICNAARGVRSKEWLQFGVKKNGGVKVFTYSYDSLSENGFRTFVDFIRKRNITLYDCKKARLL